MTIARHRLLDGGVLSGKRQSRHCIILQFGELTLERRHYLKPAGVR
jgi:hypothetical protein